MFRDVVVLESGVESSKHLLVRDKDRVEAAEKLCDGMIDPHDYLDICGENELREYFAQILPDFDRDRVHDSDIRKLLQWYDILVEAGLTQFEEDLQPTQGENIDDRKEQ